MKLVCPRFPCPEREPHISDAPPRPPMVMLRTTPVLPILRAVPDFQVVPLSKTLLVEGRGRRDSFRGLVIAIGWWQQGGGSGRSSFGGGAAGPELHYLISDQTKPAPIWVEGRQLTSQRWFPVVSPSAGEPETVS